MSKKASALQLLRTALKNSSAEFRPGQWESINALLEKQRILVVERTGWGKSMVYFLATRLLRNQGTGVTLLISPLLSLMRNQIEAATIIGVKAQTINSSNVDDWEVIEQELREDKIDILLISPERLGNDKFFNNILSYVADRIGLFVIDEAHCISDWGHDFRPDYRHIVRIIQSLPPNIPLLATTATANNRVVNDIISQIGEDFQLERGPLVRQSLHLQNMIIPSPAGRMAWLASTIPKLPGSGIIYTLTQRDADRVSDWLVFKGIKAKAYHAGLKNPDGGHPIRQLLEEELLNNKVKVLVATVALGMGFDKPDLGFVIHFQRPNSVVHYYQQVGRAGRAVDQAYGILMHGEEDNLISEYFIRNSFPPQSHISEILDILDNADSGLSISQMQGSLNLRYMEIDKALKYLSVESPSPVTKVGSRWNATAAAAGYNIDQDYVDSIKSIRQREQREMADYMNHDGCLMEFLAKTLDDPDARLCGKCAGCRGEPIVPTTIDDALVNEAAIFLKRCYLPIPPRKLWPAGSPLKTYTFSGRIGDDRTFMEGRALSLWRDAGWGLMVTTGKQEKGYFSDELVSACTEMIRGWKPEPAPKWLTCIPSLEHPDLVPSFAKRLSDKLNIPFSNCIAKVLNNSPQKQMQNSFQQTKNLDGAFRVNMDKMKHGPCFLVDDMVDSRWTFTVAAALLRQAGCEAIFPVALALNSPRMD